jgi:4'-phosphopantetheinyl transferase
MILRIILTSLDEVDLGPAQGSFSAEEVNRAGAIASDQRRRRFLARRWMARSLLAQVTGEGPAELVLERRCERCGELHPASPLTSAAGEAVWWSASSSGGTAAVAIAPSRVGLDLERGGERPRWERIADRYFSAEEAREAADSPTRFLQLWTLKEAYLKALGLGLPGGLRSLDCAALVAAEEGWSAGDAHPGWRFRSLDLGPGLVAALAVEGVPDSIEIRSWSAESEEPG